MNSVELNSLKETRKMLNDGLSDVCNGYPVQFVIAYLDFIISTQEIVNRLRKHFGVEDEQ